LGEALRYKLEGSGFDSRWCQWNYSSTKSFRPYYGPVSESASNRDDNKEYFLGDKGCRCLGMTTSSPYCVDCLELLRASNFCSAIGLPTHVMG
jgi:hypothetical protein